MLEVSFSLWGGGDKHFASFDLKIKRWDYKKLSLKLFLIKKQFLNKTLT